MAGEVLSTTSNYGQAHVDAFIPERLIQLGTPHMQLRKFGRKEKIQSGLGDTIRFLDLEPLDLPVTKLSEAQDPAKTSSAITAIEATVDHFGAIVGISEDLKIFTQFDVLEAHLKLLGRVLGTKDEQEIADVVVAGTNVIFAGNATSRSNLDSADKFSTVEIRKTLSRLFHTDGFRGETPRYPDRRYVAVVDGDLMLDLQTDSVWETAMTRQSLAKLEADPFLVMDWQGCRFYATNWLPRIDNLGDATTGTPTNEHDAVITQNDGGGTLGDFVSVLISRKHKKRLFEEGYYIVDASGDNAFGDDGSVSVQYPSNTSYLYQSYVGDDTASQATATTNLKLAASNQAAGSTSVVTASPTGAAPSVVWTVDAGEKIRLALFMGEDAFAIADMTRVDPFVVSGPDSGNVLNLFTDLGVKWRDKSVITQNQYLVRVEAHTDQ